VPDDAHVARPSALLPGTGPTRTSARLAREESDVGPVPE
jgi:hypothetical protein